ncbi:MAG: anti-sigma F factor [Clostridiales bacterium]|nr:anti-sigma F factor [Clostridiales bacterium]MDY3745778.1 anti-sigma F factor [Lachnospiraceae bacterium]
MSEIRGKSNEMEIVFDSCSENESFARLVIAAFITNLDPTLEEMADIKTAVSEAVTNCVIHGYNGGAGKIRMKCRVEKRAVTIEVTDSGVGIENIEKAMEPLYTTKPELERSGMGFSFMEAFMDSLSVESTPGQGTKIVMEKVIGQNHLFEVQGA